VTQINAKQTQPLEEVEPQIREQLSSDMQAQEFSTWIQEQEKKRDVKYLPGYKPPEQ
jgi:peptidyl-prolyl cis-trans isomerase C